MNGKRLPIRQDRRAAELRKLAPPRRESDRAAAARMLAIANALEGMTRAEAARLAGMERQALRDAVVRYNAEGLAMRAGLPASTRLESGHGRFGNSPLPIRTGRISL